jgi:hypothetical protein
MNRIAVAQKLVKLAKELQAEPNHLFPYNKTDATNTFHALDQLLIKIIEYGDFIRALGARKEDDALKKFGLDWDEIGWKIK